MDKKNIKAVSNEELASFLESAEQPTFRLQQILQWLWACDAESFDEMTNLPLPLRRSLDQQFYIPASRVESKQVSEDGTRKYLIAFGDGTSVETVGIPSQTSSRLTVCFSTQAGCPMGCAFCATGLSGYTRNLEAYEMFDQVKTVQNDFVNRVSNVVAMGQGEPFANYDELMKALRLMNDEEYLGIGARRITISTCGLIPGIERLTQEPEQFTLAVSLHSAVQRTRDFLMPGVASYPLTELRDALKKYGDTTKRRPTLEYTPIACINDDDAHIEALVEFCKEMLCHVNLIPLNPVMSSDTAPTFQPSDRIEHIESVLTKHGIEASIRTSRGQDIDGACGQLKQRGADGPRAAEE